MKVILVFVCGRQQRGGVKGVTGTGFGFGLACRTFYPGEIPASEVVPLTVPDLEKQQQQKEATDAKVLLMLQEVNNGRMASTSFRFAAPFARSVEQVDSRSQVLGYRMGNRSGLRLENLLILYSTAFCL